MSYGAMIRKWREQKKWTQRQLADAVGCSDGYVAHMENEIRPPSREICTLLAQVFGLSSQEQQELLDAVEAARRRRAEKRLRTRAGAVQGPSQTRGTAKTTPPEPKSEDIDAESIARDLAANPDLLAAYRALKTALAAPQPQLRDAVLNALEAFAQAARTGS